MKESNDTSLKVSNYWKKALYSSVVLGAIFVGGQYVSSVNANADTTNSSQNANQPVATQIQFNDATSQSNITDGSNNSLVVTGYVGQQVSLVNTKIKLQDLGYDVSNIPDTYTPTTAGSQIYPTQIKHIGTENEPNNLTGQYKLIFDVKDQNGNYIESKYDSTDGSGYSFGTGDSSYNSTAKKIVDSVVQDQDKFNFKFDDDVLFNDDIDTDVSSLKPGDNVITIGVVAPTHTLTINYVNQNGVTVFKTTRQVTNFGHTNFYDDQNYFGDDNIGIQINPDQPYVANNQSTATVHVTTNEAFQVPSDPSQVSSYNHGYAQPDIISMNDAHGAPNPTGDVYYTTVTFVGADGQTIVSAIVGSKQSQIIDTSQLDTEENDYDAPVDFGNVTDMPTSIDLTKGPYTFHSTDTLSALLQSSAAAQSAAASDQQSSSSDQTSQSNQVPQSIQSSQASQASQSSQSAAIQQPAKSSSQPSSAPVSEPKPAPVAESHPVSTPTATAKPVAAPSPAQAEKPGVKSSQQPAKSVDNSKPASQTSNTSAKIKPSKKLLKAITKSFKQSKRAVKTDNAKLKALKKKMKKHATKKQKAAYKALQTKLAADKKAVKSYKAQEGKLTKYFKEVSVINRDNKQIKSLTSQANKLKKNHSKASKKKYAKVQKALKKANNSLKAATKFVNDYK